MAKSQGCPEPTPPKRPHAIAFDPALGRTEQSHKAACDINNIMARYTKTGTLDHVRRYEGQYLDLPPCDYQQSLLNVAEAKSMFEELPSQLRRHFANSTQNFLEFCVNSDDPSTALGAIAEEYRKQALGIDENVEKEAPNSSGKDAARGAAQDSAKDGGSEGKAEAN